MAKQCRGQQDTWGGCQKMQIVDIIDGKCDNLLIRQFPGAERLIFAFSHVDYPAGKFAMTNVFTSGDFRANIIFINCRDNSWYQNGINQEYDSIEKCRNLFEELLQYFAPNRTLAVGMSMGGYAAVLFGLLLDLDYVTAFTPEIILDLPYCRSVTLNKLRSYDFRHISLQYLLSANRRTVVNAIYGAYDLIDLALLWPISHLLGNEDNKLRVTFCSEGHQVPLALDVGNLVRGTFVVGQLQPRDIRAGIVLRTQHSQSELYAYWRSMHYRVTGDLNSANAVLTSESDFSKLSWMNLFLAENYRDAADPDRAIDYFSLTAEQDPTSHYAWFRLALFAESQSKIDMAINAGQKALSLKPGDIVTARFLEKLAGTTAQVVAS